MVNNTQNRRLFDLHPLILHATEEPEAPKVPEFNPI